MVGDAGVQQRVRDGRLAKDAGSLFKAHGGSVVDAVREGAETFGAVEEDVAAVSGRVATRDPEGDGGVGVSISEGSESAGLNEKFFDDVDEGADVTTAFLVERISGDTGGNGIAGEGTAHGDDIDGGKAAADDREEFKAGHARHVEV